MYDQEDIQKYRAGLLARNPEMLAKVTEIRKRLGILPSNDVAEALFDPYAKDNSPAASSALSTGAQMPENDGMVKPFPAAEKRTMEFRPERDAGVAVPLPNNPAEPVQKLPLQAAATPPAPAQDKPMFAPRPPVSGAPGAVPGPAPTGMQPSQPSQPAPQAAPMDYGVRQPDPNDPAEIAWRNNKARLNDQGKSFFFKENGRMPSSDEIMQLEMLQKVRPGVPLGALIGEWMSNMRGGQPMNTIDRYIDSLGRILTDNQGQKNPRMNQGGLGGHRY